MSITDEFARLQELHESGALTESEFTAAKAKVLTEGGGPAAQNAGLQRDVRRLGVQNQILQLDQDWEKERREYMAYGKHGDSFIPTFGSSIIQAAMLFIVGLVFCMLMLNPNHPHPEKDAIFPILGIPLMITGVWVGVNGCTKASRYEQAEARYQQRRAELTDQLNRL